MSRQHPKIVALQLIGYNQYKAMVLDVCTVNNKLANC